jgi:hypothetical protein
MASNFHNILGFLAVGVDGHEGLQILLPPPPGEPEFPFPELVCAHPYALGPGWKFKVLINGVPSVVNGHASLIPWPHYPIVPMNAFFALDMLFGDHSCWLPRGTVFIEDEVSTCCIIAGVSTNVDCCDFGFPMTNLIIQIATVQTTPSLSDFLSGALSVALNAALSKAQGALFKKFKPLKKLSDKAEGLAHKLAVRASKKGLGYKIAKKLGSNLAGQVPGLAGRKLAGRSKALGRALEEEFLKRAGLSAQTPLNIAKKAFDFDPMRPVNSALGRPTADGKPAWSPFKPFDGIKGLEGIPLYDKGNGGVQTVTGGG